MSTRRIFVAVTAVFLLISLSLAAVMTFYWIEFLRPRLQTEAIAQADITARSQANLIVNAIRAGDGATRVHNVISALDELLLLQDTQTKTPFFRTR